MAFIQTIVHIPPEALGMQADSGGMGTAALRAAYELLNRYFRGEIDDVFPVPLPMDAEEEYDVVGTILSPESVEKVSAILQEMIAADPAHGAEVTQIIVELCQERGIDPAPFLNAFVPMSGEQAKQAQPMPGGAPMDPNMMMGGMPPGGAPMPPPGAPPMDPAMMGGGMPPVGGGMPPPPPAGPPGGVVPPPGAGGAPAPGGAPGQAHS